MRVLALDRATAEAVDRLRDAGIRSILLKGPALSRWIYPDESHRHYHDADLLVAPDTFERAESALGEIGFRRMGLDTLPVDRPHYAMTLRRPDSLAIDLHRRLVGIGVAEDAAWAVLTERTGWIEVGGASVEILAREGTALALCLHAAKDGARSPQVIGDMERALDVIEESVWRDTAVLAARLDALPGLVAGLRRVDRGAALVGELDLPDDASAEFLLRQERPPPMAVGAKWFLEERGFRLRARVALHKLFPTPDFMRAWQPLARRGRAGLVLAYLWRPVWMLLHAGPAVKAARDAQRRALPGAPDQPQG